MVNRWEVNKNFEDKCLVNIKTKVVFLELNMITRFNSFDLVVKVKTSLVILHSVQFSSVVSDSS